MELAGKPIRYKITNENNRNNAALTVTRVR
jgi:hypothetical protein